MKKSHRKDVIIARIIFAVLCLLLITLIAVVVMLIRGKMADHKKDTQSSQLESQLPPVTENPDLPPVTENPENVIVYVWTNDGVNLREEPNTDCAVITVLDAGTQLELLEEAVDGWAHVSWDGQEGYVSMDYITDTNPSGEEAE
jgi:uncharacterized protein YgiM (DUF1202 family)